MTYIITQATEAHLSVLPEIERQAASLFIGYDLPQELLAETTPLEKFRAAMHAGYLWVALADALPIGFAHAELLGPNLHLEELDVHPAHGRRGVGRALVEAVCACARAQGRGPVTLTTFREIPFNEPFYHKLGFRLLAAEALSPELQRRVAEEAARGLQSHRRIVMSKQV